jgi:hypothetical protein
MSSSEATAKVKELRQNGYTVTVKEEPRQNGSTDRRYTWISPEGKHGKGLFNAYSMYSEQKGGGDGNGGGIIGNSDDKSVYKCAHGDCTFDTTTTNKEGGRRCPCKGYGSDERARKHSCWVPQERGEEQEDPQGENLVYKCVRPGCTYGTTTKAKARKGKRRCPCAGSYGPNITGALALSKPHAEWVVWDGSESEEEGGGG